jgi:hypothetical protein
MGCRPGFELDQFLGLGGAKPKTAEDVLGMVLGLSPIEQQRLISLITAKYVEYLSGELKDGMIELSDINN